MQFWHYRVRIASVYVMFRHLWRGQKNIRKLLTLSSSWQTSGIPGLTLISQPLSDSIVTLWACPMLSEYYSFQHVSDSIITLFQHVLDSIITLFQHVLDSIITLFQHVLDSIITLFACYMLSIVHSKVSQTVSSHCSSTCLRQYHPTVSTCLSIITLLACPMLGIIHSNMSQTESSHCLPAPC